MKKTILFLFLVTLVLGCKNDDDTSVLPVNENKVLVLKVDFETNILEEGKELIFETEKDFGITTEYMPPGDFGSIALLYEDTEEKIFSGTIIWSGTGAISYPENFIASSDFEKEDMPLEMPDITVFQNVIYDEHIYYPDVIAYQEIWDAIDSIKLLKEYRASNPGANIHLLLYTPAVGIFDPSLADWIIIVKN